MAEAIDAEFRAVCSFTHDTLLKDGLEAVKQNSWEAVWCELHAVVYGRKRYADINFKVLLFEIIEKF